VHSSIGLNWPNYSFNASAVVCQFNPPMNIFVGDVISLLRLSRCSSSAALISISADREAQKLRLRKGLTGWNGKKTVSGRPEAVLTDESCQLNLVQQLNTNVCAFRRDRQTDRQTNEQTAATNRFRTTSDDTMHTFPFKIFSIASMMFIISALEPVLRSILK